MLKKIQKEANDWMLKNFGKTPSYRMLLGVTEEIGELSHAHLKQEQNIRVNEDHQANKKDAIGDITIYLIQYCNIEGFDFESIVKETWNTVKQRDWIKNNKDGSI